MTEPAAMTRSERMARVADPAGHFAILAIDHVRSFAAVLNPADPETVAAEEIIDLKVGIVDRLVGHTSAVLIDPAFATAGAGADAMSPIVSRLVGVGGVVLGIEDGDYADVHTTPRLLPGWGVEQAAELGVDAVKISVFFDADEDNALACRFVEQIGNECARFHMPLFCEPLALLSEDAPDRRRHILEGVRLFGGLGVDVLKIQFPERSGPEVTPSAWADACAAVDQASSVPWTLLSEGRDFGLFLRRLEAACRSGASGFLGGRAVWGDAVGGGGDLSVSATRLDQLAEVVRAHASPWTARVAAEVGEELP